MAAKVESISFLKAHDRVPIYPLGLVLVHLVFALYWLASGPTPSANVPYALFFLAATVAIVLLTDTLVIYIGRPRSALEFLGQKWTATNTHALAFVLVGGAVAVPADGNWTDARAAIVGTTAFVLGLVALVYNLISGDHYSDEVKRQQREGEIPVTRAGASKSSEAGESEKAK